MDGAQTTLGLVDVERTQRTTWFSSQGGVYRDGDRCQIFVGGSLIGEFGPGDVGARNLLAVGLATDPHTHLGQLAAALPRSRRRTSTGPLDHFVRLDQSGQTDMKSVSVGPVLGAAVRAWAVFFGGFVATVILDVSLWLPHRPIRTGGLPRWLWFGLHVALALIALGILWRGTASERPGRRALLIALQCGVTFLLYVALCLLYTTGAGIDYL